jgi:protein SMG5
LILEFSKNYDGWMKSLKMMFDWLHLDTETTEGCYRSNPEFIAKIMRLINFVNIDIFTRKIYFDSSMIKFKNVREDLRHLFDIRHQIATSDDVTFKKCAVFEELQQPIDWNLNYKLQITPEEDIVLRNFKMIDFGFHLCKVKKFNYSFCARSRIFIEKQSRRRGERRRSRRNSGDCRRSRRNSDDCNRRFKEERGTRRERRRNRRRRKDRDDRKPRNSESDRFERLSIKTHSSQEVVEEYPSIEKSNQCSRKGYLKNKIAEKETREKSEAEKNEMMGKLGKLWLKNEVQTLESRSKPVNTNLTPYLMLDTIALIDYLYVVKNLVKTKKFVVLIPKAGKFNSS